MGDTSQAPEPSSFFSGVNDFLGAVNAFGNSAANLRDRFRAQPPAQGGRGPSSFEPSATIAPQPAQPTQLGAPPSRSLKPWLIGGALLLAVGVLAVVLVKK